MLDTDEMETNGLKDGKIQPTIEVYRKRWIILIIYILCSCLSTAQWIEYSIINNVVMKYYHVSATTVDWTSMSFSIMWPILVFPVSYIIDKMGLRAAVFIGILLTALGAGVKVLSVGENLFYVVLLGQVIVSISQIFLLNLPPKLSAVWFKPEEISTVCSLGILGMTSGTAISYFIPPIMVRDSDNLDEIAEDLRVMCWGVFLLSIPLVLIVFFYFPERPLNPPSMAMFEERNNRNEVTISLFAKSFELLMKNKAFHVHNVAFGCNLGIYTAIGTFLNQFVLSYFPNAQEDAGRMGSMMIIFGIGGSVLTDYGIHFIPRMRLLVLADKIRQLSIMQLGVITPVGMVDITNIKETSFLLFLLGTLGLGGVLYAMSAQNKWLTYLAITVFGIFLSGYLPAGVEFGTEITYPSPESTVMGILYATSQIITVVLTIIFGKIIAKFGAFWALTGMIITMAVGTTLTLMTPNNLKRQKYFISKNSVEFTQLPQQDNKNYVQRIV